MADRELPEWADQIRRRYVRGESSMFVLHQNVYDRLHSGGSFHDLPTFLAQVLLADNKDVILHYDPSKGLQILKKATSLVGLDIALQLANQPSPQKVMPYLETVLLSTDSVAVIISYAGMLVPSGEMSFLSEQDRANVFCLHRWSLNTSLGSKDNVVFLISEFLTELHPKLLSNPKVAAVEIPLPSLDERRTVIHQADAGLTDEDVRRLAEHTAGLKAVQIESLLTPRESEGLDDDERERHIRDLLGNGKDADERATKLTRLTRGMSREEIAHLINPDYVPPDLESREEPDALADVRMLIHARKREIIEKECAGLIEFVTSTHDFSAVGGQDEIKRELRRVAYNIKTGQTTRVPMGLLFVGPMGTGKTFVASAFSNEAGLTALKLKSFRSKWVGETESNLEKVLSIVKVMGPVIVIIDEGDRSFGNQDESGDSGTSSRVIARLKEFMSDTDNRGRVLFIVMTNRPDKLDVDIKRAGRLDRKIPFFYAQEAEDVESVLDALFRRYDIETTLDWRNDRADTSAKLVGYSNADLEAVVLLSNDLAQHDGLEDDADSAPVTAEIFAQAVGDYLPSREALMLEYMEMLAVFEASNRRLLPKKYRDLSAEDLNERLMALRRALAI
ncbi:MAG: ATP-binding protein [Deltaproteobacteria bacterium]|nr:ATP-binding protein [bacterium]MCB9479366.1 ATP-binding protein [Deltaproteobacteria bacterium]MCB9488950.1 ATP-binding protein [Deltaproteobacteria bacterium]